MLCTLTDQLSNTRKFIYLLIPSHSNSSSAGAATYKLQTQTHTHIYRERPCWGKKKTQTIKNKTIKAQIKAKIALEEKQEDLLFLLRFLFG